MQSYYQKSVEGYDSFTVRSYLKSLSYDTSSGCTTPMITDKSRDYVVPAVANSSTNLRYLPEPVTGSAKIGDTNAIWTRVKKTREIRMTNYEVFNMNTTYFAPVYKREFSLNGYAIRGSVTKYNNSCPGFPCMYCWLPRSFDSSKDAIQVKAATTSYRTDIFNISSDIPGIQSFLLSPVSDPSERMKVMSDTVSKVALDFDALTTLAESKETLTLIINLIKGILKPLSTLAKLARDTRRNPLKEGSSAWLTYRYGIMPVIYTIEDLIKLLKQAGFMYQTFRSEESSDLKFPQRDMSVPHIFNVGVASLTYRGTGKVMYDSQFMRLAARTSVNPVATVWELVPYSFVADWFIDVSGFIRSQTLALASLATDQKFCISEKLNYSLDTYLYIPSETKLADIPTNHYGYEGNGLYGNTETKAVIPQSMNYHIGGEFLLSSENMDSYKRDVFQPGDIELQFHTDLNWLRGIDALALSALKINQLLRKIR